MRTSDLDAAATLPWLTPMRLSLGMAGFCLLIMLFGTCLLYGATGPLPAPRRPASLADPLANVSHKFKEGYYRSVVDESAKRLGVKSGELRGLWRINPLFTEFTGEQRLAVNGTLETEHLRLRASSQKIWVGEEGSEGYRTEHLVLQIVNRTQRHLAYRVVTQVAGRCGVKGYYQHNALALKPGEELQRTECILNGAGPIVVRRVEVLEISPLGYFYVSQLDPGRLRLDRRTSEGHQGPMSLGTCRLLPWREIESAFQRDLAGWDDVIDFYSRHSCEEYTFFVGYHRLTKGPVQLPIKPAEAAKN